MPLSEQTFEVGDHVLVRYWLSPPAGGEVVEIGEKTLMVEGSGSRFPALTSKCEKIDKPEES